MAHTRDTNNMRVPLSPMKRTWRSSTPTSGRGRKYEDCSPASTPKDTAKKNKADAATPLLTIQDDEVISVQTNRSSIFRPKRTALFEPEKEAMLHLRRSRRLKTNDETDGDWSSPVGTQEQSAEPRSLDSSVEATLIPWLTGTTTKTTSPHIDVLSPEQRRSTSNENQREGPN